MMATPWRGQAHSGVCACLLSGLALLSAFAGSVHATSGPVMIPTAAASTTGSFVLSAPTAGCGRQSTASPGTTVDATIPADPALSAGERTRAYRVHLPASYAPGDTFPVVLAFHGYSGDSAGMERMTGFSALADQGRFIAVYPQGLTGIDGQPFWASVGTVDLGIDEVRFVSDLLDALESAFCIDTARIYATGFSNGGAMAAFLACRLSDRIAAFAPVSGNFYAPRDGCFPTRPVAILDIHGTADRVVTYYGVPEAINPRWPLPSIPMWLREWAARDNCTDEPTLFSDGPGVTRMEWISCTTDVAITHYRIDGGGHEWPAALHGRPVAAVMWDFFQAHPLPGA